MPRKKKATEHEDKCYVIIDALDKAKDINEAAEIAGVSCEEIYRIMQREKYIIAQYKELQRNHLRGITNKIAGGAMKSAECLIAMLDDEATPPNIKLQVCTKIIELYAKFRDLEGYINKEMFNQITHDESDDFESERTFSGL